MKPTLAITCYQAPVSAFFSPVRSRLAVLEKTIRQRDLGKLAPGASVTLQRQSVLHRLNGLWYEIEFACFPSGVQNGLG
jgi:hypothetical protein